MLYYKIIEGREVFSDCKALLIDGRWISNPDATTIANDGWLPYVPPVVPPEPATDPSMDEVMEAVKKMLSPSVESLTDEEALAVAALYPTFVSKIGESVTTGERLWWDERLWKVLQPHTIQEDWTPDTAVSLYVEVSIEEWPEIPENIPAEKPYMNGDKGTWKGNHYICQMDNCVWNPDQLPSAWRLV